MFLFLLLLHRVPRMNGDMDTKGLDIRHHGIKFLIDNVLDKVANVPECKTEVDCHDCEQWTFSQ